MSKFKLIIGNILFEVEGVYDNKRSKSLFDIYQHNKKMFSIEPVILYGHGDEILWELTEEYELPHVRQEIVKKLGAAIEKLIN